MNLDVRRLDPRLKVLFAVLLGALAWSSGLPGLAAMLVGLCWLLLRLRAALPGGRAVLRGYVWFLLFWALAKAGLDLWSGVGALAALAGAGMLTLRLTCLLGTGLALAVSTSPRQLGMALTWFLRPILRGRAWKAALALALMVHFLPITWETVARVRANVARRLPGARFWTRQAATARAVLRVLGQKTWNQTLAVACRGLGEAAAWEPEFPAGGGRAAQWGLGGVLALLLGALSLL
ncbi:MAG: cobalt transporter [Desulfovibrionaceae bacterium]